MEEGPQAAIWGTPYFLHGGPAASRNASGEAFCQGVVCYWAAATWPAPARWRKTLTPPSPPWRAVSEGLRGITPRIPCAGQGSLAVVAQTSAQVPIETWDLGPRPKDLDLLLRPKDLPTSLCESTTDILLWEMLIRPLSLNLLNIKCRI